VIVGANVCAVSLALVIGGMVVLVALRLFVDWKWWKPPTWWDWVGQEFERAAGIRPALSATGALAVVGGLLFLAINGC
jgi:hypothetical protein